MNIHYERIEFTQLLIHSFINEDVKFVEILLKKFPYNVLASVLDGEEMRGLLVKFLEDLGCEKGGILHEETFDKYKITRIFKEPFVKNKQYDVTNDQLRCMIYDFLDNKAARHVELKETVYLKLKRGIK